MIQSFQNNKNDLNKTIVNIHLQHGGGTFICNIASKFYGDTIKRQHNCNLLGTGPGDVVVTKSCEEQTKHRFFGFERGFETYEFCPKHVDYLFIMRNPLNRMNSLLMDPRSNVPVDEVLKNIETKNWEMKKYYNGWYTSWFRYKKNGVGHGLMVFDNIAVRYFSNNSSILHKPLNTIDYNDFLVAKKNVEQVKYICTLEKIFTKTSSHHNSHSSSQLSEKYKEFLIRQNVFDLYLYSIASNRCNVNNIDHIFSKKK